jgi:hypothetical protein
MTTGKITLLAFALAMMTLTATACNKTGPSATDNVNSSTGKDSSSSPAKASAASNRFVGTWTEEGQKNDKGTTFTEDGKVIEVSTGKQVGTYTSSGNDKATITIAEGGGGTATLESENRMRLQVGTETTVLIRK